MPATYEPIATNTLSGSAASVTFSSIPSTYTDLVLVCNSGQNTTDYLMCQLNSDTATNYSFTILNGDGTSAVSNRKTSQTGMQLDWYSYSTVNVIKAVHITHFMNYSNTTTNKTVLTRSSTDRGSEALVGLWRSTSAISTISLYPFTGTFLAGSTFTLYGIKAA